MMDGVVIRRNQTLQSALQQAFDSNLLTETTYTMKLCWKADENDSWHDFTPANYNLLEFQLYKDPEPEPPVPTDIDEINHKSKITNHKYIKNGLLFIEHNGHLYNAQGLLIK